MFQFKSYLTTCSPVKYWNFIHMLPFVYNWITQFPRKNFHPLRHSKYSTLQWNFMYFYFRKKCFFSKSTNPINMINRHSEHVSNRTYTYNVEILFSLLLLFYFESEYLYFGLTWTRFEQGKIFYININLYAVKMFFFLLLLRKLENVGRWDCEIWLIDWL